MGIPGLTRQLQSFGERQRYTPHDQNGNARRHNVIVDGPALAYYVYHMCLANQPYSTSPFENVPSYRQLGEVTLLWLRQLTVLGFAISNIFFDGYLPPYKLSERQKRLQESIDRMIAVRQIFPDHLGTLQPGKATGNINTRHSTSPQRLQLDPPMSFISALIGALRGSEFGPATAVVPGEADGFCVQEAQKAPALIFTSDSDLLIRPLDGQSRVVLLKDMEIFATDPHPHADLIEYSPSRIAEQCGLPDLITCVYQMKHRACSFREAVTLAKGEPPAGDDFKAFKLAYRIETKLPPLLESLPALHAKGVADLLQRVDVRLLELVYNLEFAPFLADARPGTLSLQIYLPILVQDPRKTSAFRASSSIRGLTYSALRLIDTDLTSIAEYSRSGGKLATTSFDTVSAAELESQLGDFVSSMQSAHDRYQRLPCGGQWRAVLLDLVINAPPNADKERPTATHLYSIILNDSYPDLDWEWVNIRAQVQAAMYSLLCLKQVLGLLTVLLPSLRLASSLIATLRSGMNKLGSLPTMAEVLDWQDCTSPMQVAQVDAIKVTLAGLGKAEESGRAPKKRKIRNTKAKKNLSQASVQAPQKVKHANPFEALADP